MSNYNNYIMNDTISVIARIREGANKLILAELEKAGLAGIVPSHGDIIAVLLNHKKCTMKTLANKIHRTKATLTVLVDKLEKMGFLVRQKSAEDNRVVYIVLTPKGESLKPVFEEISVKLNNQAFKGVEKKNLAKLNVLLKKISKNLE